MCVHAVYGNGPVRAFSTIRICLFCVRTRQLPVAVAKHGPPPPVSAAVLWMRGFVVHIHKAEVWLLVLPRGVRGSTYRSRLCSVVRPSAQVKIWLLNGRSRTEACGSVSCNAQARRVSVGERGCMAEGFCAVVILHAQLLSNAAVSMLWNVIFVACCPSILLSC